MPDDKQSAPEPDHAGADRRKPTGNGTTLHAAIGAAAGAKAGVEAGQMGIKGAVWQNIVQTTFAVVVVYILLTNISDERGRMTRENQREMERVQREDKREVERQRRDDQREQYMREDLREQRSQQRLDSVAAQKQVADNTAAIRELAAEVRATRLSKTKD